jgi:hypothetical protein
MRTRAAESFLFQCAFVAVIFLSDFKCLRYGILLIFVSFFNRLWECAVSFADLPELVCFSELTVTSYHLNIIFVVILTSEENLGRI